jgi:DNA-binding NarL/FixJ family response regulator
MAKKIRVLLADDHPAFRDGLRAAILGVAELQLVGEAADGDTALQLIRDLQPDVAVLDIAMPKLSGLQVARQLQQRGTPLAHIVFLTMHNERDMFDKAMDAGAKGYVLKESAVTDIVESIRTVATGRHYLSPGISHYLVQRAEYQETFRKTQSGLDSLTSAERRVLKLISLDRTSKEIADELGVSPRTIEAHRQNICNKLDLHGSHSLLRFAFDHRKEL